MIRVWDPLVRSLHWLLAASVLAAWTSGHGLSRWFDEIHHIAGYLAVFAVVVRTVWGFVGARHARFGQFVRSPRATWVYARQLRARCEPRYIGHNPLGGWMVLVLLVTVACLSLSGFLYTTDWLWGYAWLSDLHATLAWVILGLVLGHVAGVVLMSLRHGENLVAAMLHGRKRAARSGDIDHALHKERQA
ncbi:MAG: cytochrome b/b6 domain-containing protein [Burkholderiales bacterium]